MTHRLRTVLAIVVAVLVVPGTAVAASQQDAHAGHRASAAHDFRFPGADTIPLQDGSGRYITYGASAQGRKVPFSISGHGGDVGTSRKIAGDALPNGGGSWTKPGSGIWAPGAFYHVKKGVGRYYLFYTGLTKAGRRCIGVASSTSATAGFATSAKPLLCPTKGTRWALDADVTSGPDGAIWLVWRDGQRAIGAESAISAVLLKLTKLGVVHMVTKPKVIMRSNNLTWAHYKDGSGVTVIENPSAIYLRGSWYLFFSGNSWPTNYYATGVAYCGAALNDGLCRSMPGPKRAYFSYSGPKVHLPASMRYRGLPGNYRGPGAMAVYLNNVGKPWVTWNYLHSGGRRSTTAHLRVRGTGGAATFRVVR
ncbi:MAG TPA: family 43 glycosylhydrolase [Jatrophihabitantaceae bacterium]